MTTARMTKQSKKNLLNASSAGHLKLDDGTGFAVWVDDLQSRRAILTSTYGPLIWPTPREARNAIFRHRPDIADNIVINDEKSKRPTAQWQHSKTVANQLNCGLA